MPENLAGATFGVQEYPQLGDRLMTLTEPDRVEQPPPVSFALWSRLRDAEDAITRLQVTVDLLQARIVLLEQPWWWARLYLWICSLRG